MNSILGLLGLVLAIAVVIGTALSSISILTLGGYFFARLILKILGLHSGSAEQVRNEIKLAVGSGILVLVTVALSLLIVWMSGD
jgi:hypothetical protein